MTFFQEFDLEIKPTHILRGQGICKLVFESVPPTDSHYFTYDQSPLDNKVYFFQNEVLCTNQNFDLWYAEIKYCLKNSTTMSHLNSTQ